MDDSDAAAPLRGLRLKWRRTSDGQSVSEGIEVEAHNVDARSSTEDVHVKQPDFPEFAAETDFGLDLGFDVNSNALDDASQYEPSFAEQSADDDVIVDVGGVSSALDDVSAVDDQFIRGAQCSTLVDNVLSRHACKQCCDVQHVGLGYVGLFCVLPYLLPSLSSLYVPVRFLMVDLLLCFQKGSRYFELPTL